MATLEAPVRPAHEPASRTVCHRALFRFPQRRKRAPHARRHRESPRPTRPRVRPDHRRQARQDHRQDQVAEPVEALADRRHPPEGRQGARRARHEGRTQGLRILEPHPGRRARQPALPRRRSHAPAQDGIHGLAGLRSQQELGRGRRRHFRDHRLLRVLRARSAALRQGANAHPVARRARHACTTFRSAWAR